MVISSRLGLLIKPPDPFLLPEGGVLNAAADENEAKEGFLPRPDSSPPDFFHEAGKGVEGRLLLLPSWSRKELGLLALPGPLLRIGVDGAESEFPLPAAAAGLS